MPDDTSMMAWRVHAFGPPEAMRFEHVPIPAPGSGEVLVPPLRRDRGDRTGRHGPACRRSYLWRHQSALHRCLCRVCSGFGRHDCAQAGLAGLHRSRLRSRHRRDGVAGTVRRGGAYGRPDRADPWRGRQRWCLCGADGAPCRLRSIATTETADVDYVRDLGADTVVDFPDRALRGRGGGGGRGPRISSVAKPSDARSRSCVAAAS